MGSKQEEKEPLKTILLESSLPSPVDWRQLLDKYANLRSVHISDTTIKLSELIDSLPANQLTSLYLPNNRFEFSPNETKIPANISRLLKLEILSLSNNQIESFFPGVLHTLTQLKKLNLSKNKFRFTTTPPNLERISHFAKLEELDLSENELFDTLPAQLLALPNLVILDVSTNYLTIPPGATVNGSPIVSHTNGRAKPNTNLHELPDSILMLTEIGANSKKYGDMVEAILNSADYASLEKEIGRDFEMFLNSQWEINEAALAKATEDNEALISNTQSKLKSLKAEKKYFEILKNPNLDNLCRIEKELKNEFIEKAAQNDAWDEEFIKLFLLMNGITGDLSHIKSKNDLETYAKPDNQIPSAKEETVVPKDKETFLLRGKVELALELLKKRLFITDLVSVNEEPHPFLKKANFSALLEQMVKTQQWIACKYGIKCVKEFQFIFREPDDYLGILIYSHLSVKELYSIFYQPIKAATNSALESSCHNLHGHYKTYVKDHFYAQLSAYSAPN